MEYFIHTISIIIFISILNFISIDLPAQFWSDPVNISDETSSDSNPDICMDKNGVLHCVFKHKLWSNWRKIYYSKSIDDGETWSTPVDISLNPDTSLMNPHIVADTAGKLYVTYDYNTGNPGKTLVHLKSYDGNQWSEPFVVSEGMYNSDHNLLVVDNNNRLYVFWAYINQLTYYRYYEDGIWSDTICPYPMDDIWGTMDIVVDKSNNLHCVGAFHESGYPSYNDYVIYYQYIYDEYWTDKTFISPETQIGYGPGLDIDLDNLNNPHIIYRQKTNSKGPYSDSTMYTRFDGASLTEPELIISGDTYQQRIVIDPFDRVHIFNKEILEIGAQLIHYQKSGGLWQGYIIDDSEINVSQPDVLEINNVLYYVYYKCFSNEDCRIRFTKNILLTNSNVQQNTVAKINIYPNPFSLETTIEFEVEHEKPINISIYNLNGQHIKNLNNKKVSPGNYNLTWNGTDKNGKEVTPGLYIISLRSGRFNISKPVEFIK